MWPAMDIAPSNTDENTADEEQVTVFVFTYNWFAVSLAVVLCDTQFER